jgi:ABC-2 type transport system ATP-binding protein
MLTINILEKKYSNQVILENIILKIDSNGIYGLVGKNGQGKTTLFKCVLGLENYSGKSTIDGDQIELQKVAWCPTEPSVYGELTAIEFYDFYKHLLDLETPDCKPLFEVPNNSMIKEFSTGMKKKVYLNAVFQKKYNLYLLDEPFNGLDLESNYILMQYLIQRSKESIVVISSHIMDILYNNCEQIFVVNNKRLAKFEKESFNQIQKTLFEE